METLSALTCSEMVEILSDYLEGFVPSDTETLCAEHLADCAGCEEYLRGLIYTIGSAKELCARDSSIPVDRLSDLFREHGLDPQA